MSLIFNGSSDHVLNNSQIIGAYPFTIKGWARTSNKTIAQTIFSLVDKDVDNIVYSMGFGGSSDFSMTAQNTTEQTVVGGTVVNNVWYHVAVVFTDATTRELFVNAVSVVTDNNSVNYSTLVDRFTIGVTGSSTLSKYLVGDAAEMSVVNRSLSVAEIRSDMHRKLTGGESGLVGYWPMDDAGEGTGVLIKDHARDPHIVLLDGCETADWDALLAALNETVNPTDFVEGAGSLNLGKDGTDRNAVWQKTLSSQHDLRGKNVGCFAKIEDSATLNKLHASNGLIVRSGNSLTNHRYKVWGRASLSVGWNDLLNDWDSQVVTGTGEGDAAEFIRLDIFTTNAGDLISLGDIKMDKWYLEDTVKIHNGVMTGFSGNPWVGGPPVNRRLAA